MRNSDSLKKSVTLPDFSMEASGLVAVKTPSGRILEVKPDVAVQRIDQGCVLVPGIYGTPVNMVPFIPKLIARQPDFVSAPIIEESAPVKLCAACESDLVPMKGKLVCASVGCSLYGTEQKGKR